MSNHEPIFVGRQHQLAELDGYWQAARAGNGRVVFLLGEAGIGKTTLAEHFSHQVLAGWSEARYAAARCHELTGEVSPYAPFVTLLDSLLGQAAARQGENWLADFARQVGPDVLALIPVLGPYLSLIAQSGIFARQRLKLRDELQDSAGGQFGQQNVFQQFTDALRAVAGDGPVLLFVDDWHWADDSSTNLLFYLARQLADVPILFLAAYRPETARTAHAARGHPILEIHLELRRYRCCADLELTFLGRAEIAQYLAGRFRGTRLDPGLAPWLVRISQGNALFLEQYVELLLAGDYLSADGRLLVPLEDIPVPDSVQAVLQARLDRLEDETRHLLACASVEGERFTTLLLGRVLSLDRLPLIQKLRAVEEVHRLIAHLGQHTLYGQETTLFAFVHTLVHRRLTTWLTGEERLAINRRLLETGGEFCAQADEAERAQLRPRLALLAEQSGEHLAAAQYALEAAEGAARNYAHAEVLKHCDLGLRALDRLDRANKIAETETLRAKLLSRLGGTEAFTGEWDRAIELYQKSLEIRERVGDGMAQTYNDLGNVYADKGEWDRAIEFYQKSLEIKERVGDIHGMAKTYNNLGLVYKNKGEWDRAIEFYQKSLEIKERVGDIHGMAKTYNNLGLVYADKGEWDHAIEFYQKDLEIREQVGDIHGMAQTYNNLGVVYADKGEWDRAIELYEKALETMERVGDFHGMAQTYNNLGVVYADKGEWDRAIEFYQKSLETKERVGDVHGMAITFGNLGEVYLQTERAEQAKPLLARAYSIFTQVGSPSARKAFELLVRACGSDEAAQAYLARPED